MLRLRQIKIEVTKDSPETLIKKVAKILHLNISSIKSFKINKKSIDARDKNNILCVYEVDVEVPNENELLAKNHNLNIIKTPDESYHFPKMGSAKLTSRIIIIGSGPAGLFAGYMLAQKGYKPLIIERGSPIEKRIKDVETFWEKGKLNPESNVVYGEGGAGTFSDGKLNTLIKDKRFLGKKVLEIFVAHGAPADILYSSHPHIGTDLLRDVIINIRKEIINLGGEFLYHTKLTNLFINNHKLEAIEINNKEQIKCSNLILAIGHSAKDTFEMLKANNLNMEAKPFAVGIRIMHDEAMINESTYGKYAKLLPPASYKLTYTTKDKRGVYTFCMCPGGYVVNSSSEEKHLVINGMSNHARNSGTSNSAVIVTVTPNDFGNKPLSGLSFQRELEKKAYEVGKGRIPLQLYQDFQNNQSSKSLSSASYMLKGNYTLSNLNTILPSYISDAIKEAMPNFGQKIKGFDNDNAVLAAIESRTSSPVRIIRDEHMESNIKGVYPIGEGAGYAGGITTSAIDGLKVAEELIQKYSNEQEF